MTDAFGRVTEYQYDANSRLTSMTDPAGNTTTCAYDSANRIATVNGTPCTFDANGNLLSDGTSTYAYDAANRLVSVNAPSSVILPSPARRHD